MIFFNRNYIKCLFLLMIFKAANVEGQKHLKYFIEDIDSYAPEEKK